MEQRFGVQGTTCDGIFFAEGDIPGARRVAPVRVEISRQNANLLQLKERLAADARRLGANAIVNFRYGQKAHSWWEQIFALKWDTESWHGSGDAVSAR